MPDLEPPDHWVDHFTPTRRCPNCGYEVDGAMAVTGPEPPEDGDVSICINCAYVAVFDHLAPGGQRAPNPTEQRAFDRSLAVRTAVAAVLHVLNQQPPKKGTT